ncbi:type II toxin-antitoxin system ParD family antitoxin [Mesorhizobium sp. L-8-3]|uniref:type II toxin-antitoxin system ParD family antitoxin n=1 Tax=Mesorhizobium sp. L-8-3 TaxID=2744522 RepID=UPI0019262266
MRTSKPLTVTLDKQQRSVDERLVTGAYDSASEVIRSALRALDREEKAINVSSGMNVTLSYISRIEGRRLGSALHIRAAAVSSINAPPHT